MGYHPRLLLLEHLKDIDFALLQPVWTSTRAHAHFQDLSSFENGVGDAFPDPAISFPAVVSDHVEKLVEVFKVRLVIPIAVETY